VMNKRLDIVRHEEPKASSALLVRHQRRLRRAPTASLNLLMGLRGNAPMRSRGSPDQRMGCTCCVD